MGVQSALALLLFVASSGCQRAPRASDAEIHAALTTYADVAAASYRDAARGARELSATIDALVATPSAETFASARNAWLAARVPYVQTEVFRFYDGPIDAVELMVNTWPIDESYVEAGERGASPGIVEDIEHYPALERELLVQLNGKGGETSIATGYHVIEFLLWGRDQRRDGPGDRPYTDYVQSTADARASALAQRRGRYLALTADLLQEQLESLAEAWRPKPDNYRAKFLTRPESESLAAVLKGMGSLSGAELAGERLTVAYETKHQENEHSCFSDSTHLDLAGNVQGIRNVCEGRYGAQVSGLGVCELIGRYDPALAKKLAAQVALSLEAVKAIPPPFDTAILGSDETPARQAIARSITALQHQTQSLAEAAAIMQLTAVAREASR